MYVLPRSVRYLIHLLPYRPHLTVALVVLGVMACLWWYRTRDDPVGRGKPYGRVVPTPWREPEPPPRLPATPQPVNRDVDQDRRTELGGARAGPSA